MCSSGRKVIVASGTCTCQVQLLTDGCEELRICLAQHGGLVLALGLFCHCQPLFLGFLQDYTEVEQVLHIFETAFTCEVWHGRKQLAGWQNKKKNGRENIGECFNDASEMNKPQQGCSGGLLGGLVV